MVGATRTRRSRVKKQDFGEKAAKSDSKMCCDAWQYQLEGLLVVSWWQKHDVDIGRLHSVRC